MKKVTIYMQDEDFEDFTKVCKQSGVSKNYAFNALALYLIGGWVKCEPATPQIRELDLGEKRVSLRREGE